MENSVEIPIIIVFWEKVLAEILDKTQKFPKSVRFTFSSRIDNYALDTLEYLTIARFTSKPDKVLYLQKADNNLMLLKVILRISYNRSYLSNKGFELLIREINEAGRMLGGWLKNEKSKKSF